MSIAFTNHSSYSKVTLWQKDPRFAEYEKIRKEGEGCLRVTFDRESESYKKFANWNPIPQNSQRNVSELRKHIHPATIKDNKLHRINDAALDAMDSFMWEPKIEEKITNATLVGRYITFHINGYPLFFKPTIHEVLVQLPEKVIEMRDNLYFTTETIHEKVEQCTVGNNQQYHVAVTSVYNPRITTTANES